MQIVIRVADNLPAERVDQLLQQIRGVMQQDVMSIEVENTPPRKVFAHRIPVDKIIIPPRDELYE
ncbi:hypothetical protein [Nodosilinea sp. P-1105]|uniref:hypothetical protein n=1 Tax=Nodosilinea sp. P-1105 TaxID=2546229 RepID=UPI00146C5914|nr:hypothetical protein [Nodosilinea sp. P-1105]NMF86718.1 hypothetical protein [Nodosilinea sp. P-1105]